MSDAETLMERMRSKAGTLKRLGYRIRFDLTDTGERILVDGTTGGDAAEIGPAEEDTPADTILRLSADDLAKLMAGRLSPMLAYSTGRLRIEGSTGVALKLASLLDED